MNFIDTMLATVCGCMVHIYIGNLLEIPKSSHKILNLFSVDMHVQELLLYCMHFSYTACTCKPGNLPTHASMYKFMGSLSLLTVGKLPTGEVRSICTKKKYGTMHLPVAPFRFLGLCLYPSNHNNSYLPNLAVK